MHIGYPLQHKQIIMYCIHNTYFRVTYCIAVKHQKVREDVKLTDTIVRTYI